MRKFYYNHHRGSFHDISKDTFLWIRNQPYVKEESITDRIVYVLNTDNPFVKCIEFKRNEEALNGADWEWWILLNEYYVKENKSPKDNIVAYRFRVQAKKLMVNDSNNYHLFHYSNRNGLQIELLMERAKEDRAYPLYALYTDCTKIPEKLLLDYNQNKLFNPCIRCKNGIFLLSASFIYYGYVLGEKITVRNEMLVEKSIPASIIDCVLSTFHPYYFNFHTTYDYQSIYEHHMTEITKFITFLEENTYRINDYLHTSAEFPPYLQHIISVDKHKENLRGNDSNCEHMDSLNYYFFEEYRRYIPDALSGIGVIDLRNKDRLD